MAGFTYVVGVSGTTGTSGTIVPWALKQGGRSLTIKDIGFSVGGTAVATALQCALGFYSSASTGGGTVTPVKWGNQSMPTPTTAARTLDTAPGAVVGLGPQYQIQPLGGPIEILYPLDVEPGMESVVSDYIAFQVINTGTSYPFSGHVIFEEK